MNMQKECQDLDTLRQLAETTRQRLSPVSGLVDLQVEKQVLIPQVRIQVDHERAALHGLTPAAITQALDTLSNGRKVSQIVDGNRRFDVVRRLSDQNRSTSGLRDLLIPTSSGFIPLKELAEVTETDGPNQIQREGTQRRIVVYGNGDGRRDMTETSDIRRALAEISFPEGYTTNLDGAFKGAGGADRVLSLVSLSLISSFFTGDTDRLRWLSSSWVASPWRWLVA